MSQCAQSEPRPATEQAGPWYDWYHWGLFFLAWSFFASTLLGCLGPLLAFQQGPFHTALCLFVPQGLALGCLALANARYLLRFRLVPCLFVLAIIGAFWLVNCLLPQEAAPAARPVGQWDYDSKRPWFFLNGFVLAGVLGMVAASAQHRFFKAFPFLFAAVSLLTTLVYLLNYDVQHVSARLLDKLGLGAGVHASWGASALLYLLLCLGEQPVRHRRWLVTAALGALLVQAAAAVLSGTRAAVLTLGLGVLLFAALARRRAGGLCLLVVAALAALLVVGYRLVPEATLGRLSELRETGYGPRIELYQGALEEIAQHPLGRVFGFTESAVGMEYCHNALLQLTAEAGLQSLPALALLLVLAGRRLAQNWGTPGCAFLLLTGSNILVQSFSSGSAYQAALWFFVFFVASLRGAPSRQSQRQPALALPRRMGVINSG